jgi:signal transduction histidine kinase
MHDLADDAAFNAHLKRVNARRLRLASWYFALLIGLLLLANVGLPSLRLWFHAAVQAVALVYFVSLGFVVRSAAVERWPMATLPVLFWLGAVATGMVFSVDLTVALGANPAYATTLILACVAPLWPRHLLVKLLVPLHLAYLAIVFWIGPSVSFVLLMAIGGSVAAAFGWFVAVLQYRTNRNAFDAAATIQRQKDELAAALERVSRLLDQRGEMVATVAHDLQSPLAGIRALLRTIPERVDGEGPKLREIARTCAGMQDAITRLLEAHASESEAVELRPVDLAELFAHVADTAAPAAAEKDIALECDAGGLSAVAEPVMLVRAVGNLVSNAVKFSSRGTRVRLEAHAKGAGVRVAVIDRGPGIAEAERPSLFTKFAKLGPRPTGSEPTSGLGLYIVHSLAARLQATAGYEPNPGGGSVFFIDLQAARR